MSGTNGKGSTCEMLSNVLVNAGYKVGKFISPHLIRYNDGITINNKELEDGKEVEEILKAMDIIIKEYNRKNTESVTAFEALTSFVFIYFEKQKVDIAVIESGLGGTTDCTNIINPLVSVITSISYDHMDILGNTIEEITRHEAGIIKANGSTVAVYEQDEVFNIIRELCRENNNKMHVVNKKDITNYQLEDGIQTFDYKGYKDIQINLKGKFQTVNASEVLETISILKEKGFRISEENIKEGLRTTTHKARMETLSENPLIIFDGAHNEDSIRMLKETVNSYYGHYKKKYIVSIIKTKDYKSMIKELCTDKEAVYILTNGTGPELYTSNHRLYEEAIKYVDKSTIFKEELEDAIFNARKEGEETATFVVGSLYVYKERGIFLVTVFSICYNTTKKSGEVSSMAGHSKWKNIKHKKGRADAARGKIFTKLGRELLTAVKEGGADPSANARLRDVIAKCKANNMPNDNINNAIKKAAGEGNTANYEEVVYEGYGINGVALMVDVSTDNRNRIASELRYVFSRNDGNLGTTGCVSYLFKKKGVIVVEKAKTSSTEEGLMLLAIESGAEDFSAEEEIYEITTLPEDFSNVREALERENIEFLEAEVQMLPETYIDLNEADSEKLQKLIDKLEDLDDVMNVYHNGII